MSVRRHMRIGVLVVLLTCEAVLGAVLGLASNVASALGRWPYGLDVIRRHSLRALGIGVVLTVAVSMGLWWWDRRDGDKHNSLKSADEVEPPYRGGIIPPEAECFQDRGLMARLETAGQPIRSGLDAGDLGLRRGGGNAACGPLRTFAR